MHESRLTTNIVEPTGPYTAKMAFIGEAPGEEEDFEGEPFVGSAGQLLKRCFYKSNIICSEVILDNVFCRRPPNNWVGYFFSDKSQNNLNWEGQEHVEFLRKRLISLWEQSSVNVLVALGVIPLKILTGKKRINKWRGSVLPCTLVQGFKVYPTFHPSYVNRNMQELQETKLTGEKKKRAINALPLFLLDLERAVAQADSRHFYRPEREFLTSETFTQIKNRLRDLIDNQRDSAVDIETLPDKTGPVLWCIGFAPSPRTAFTVPFIRNGGFAWSETETADLLELISEYFLCKAKKIFQNGGYDLAVLGRYYGLRVRNGTYEDTMWSHQSNYPYIMKRLEVLASIYTWEPYYKDDGKVHFGKRSSDQAEFVYNGRDCCVTYEILPTTRKDGMELGTYDNYRRTLKVFPSHLAMTLRGVRIDTEAKDYLAIDFQQKSDFHAGEVNRKAGGIYNLNSSDQKGRLLYGYLGCKIQYNRDTGKVTTDKEALQKLAKLYPASSEAGDIIRHILDYQRFAKLAQTYTSMRIDTDGRARTSYGWVSTWRTNSSGSPFVFNLNKKKQAGMNLQNIPVRTEEGRMIRRLFMADEGKILIACDLRQAEAMVVAWEAEDLMKMEQFLDPNTDVHWEYAREIFEIPGSIPYKPKALFKDRYTQESHALKEYRDLGKTTRHATNYDEGPYKFQASLVTWGFHLPFRTCRDILKSAIAKDPMLAEWKRKIREKLNADRFLISSFGDKRLCQARLNDETYRAFYAFSPQNTVGRILQHAIQDIHEKFDYIEPLLNVHDEVISQIYPKDLDRAVRDIRSAMERPLMIHGRELTIPCDFKVGPTWGDLKELEK